MIHHLRLTRVLTRSGDTTSREVGQVIEGALLRKKRGKDIETDRTFAEAIADGIADKWRLRLLLPHPPLLCIVCGARLAALVHPAGLCKQSGRTLRREAACEGPPWHTSLVMAFDEVGPWPRRLTTQNSVYRVERVPSSDAKTPPRGCKIISDVPTTRGMGPGRGDETAAIPTCDEQEIKVGE